MDSSEYVNSLAIQSEQAERIQRMRQTAFTNQSTNLPLSRSKIGSAKVRFQAKEKLASDSS